ncbi:hypothetical protein AGOR_G00098400 [Albula goreensis]|uniref:Uncharacterized protein n=1 Tax=Albula goreensis TaxID=1534307 RepID=A0A8T3DL57_9TELE|nr:hypothetical protein AGOR_G00098400 [Albula goreensis]
MRKSPPLARTGLPPTSLLSLMTLMPTGGTTHLVESPLVCYVVSPQPHSGDVTPSLSPRTILCLRRLLLGMETKRNQMLKTQKSRRMSRSQMRDHHSLRHPHRLLEDPQAGETPQGASPVSSWVELAVLDLPDPNFFKRNFSLPSPLFVSHRFLSSCPLFLYTVFFTLF